MKTLLTFFFGTIIGSGINALDYRLQTNDDWLTGRSVCPKCGHELSWWELIPIASFFFLGGKCDECNESISWRYPLVELSAGLLFVLVFQMYGVSLAGVFFAVIWTLLLLIYVHDGRTMIVPNWAVWAFNFLAFASMFTTLPLLGTAAVPNMLAFPGWSQILAGPILAVPFVLIWYFSGGRAMGLADGKLALGIGWLLGLSAGLSAIVYAFWVGAVVSLLLLASQRAYDAINNKSDSRPIATSNKRGTGVWKSRSQKLGRQLTMKTAVPFGPFLILGLLFVFATGITLL